MKLIVTGGGTGGHVYPAVEVAKAARASGWDVSYFGSIRGQEMAASAEADLPFAGFPSEPLYSMRSIKGIKAAINLLKAVTKTFPAMKAAKPDVVFATGGYSSAPILHVARKLGIATVLHEQNSVPGRTLLMASHSAKSVCTVFHGSASHFPGVRVERTGMPVRAAFRSAVSNGASHVLVVGGSQGSAALNDVALATAVHSQAASAEWLHVSGKSHFESVKASSDKLGLNGRYHVEPFLSGAEMALALANSKVVVARSGAGTISELAVVGVPGIFVPYPSSFGDHQTANAREIVELGGGTLLPQNSLTVEALESAISQWIKDEDQRSHARAALKAWDVPDASERILAIINQVAAN